MVQARTSRPVLLVDDDEAFRALARRLVGSWGHDVEEAATVAEALERADALRPHTVLADIGLPDGDGFDLARRLLELPWSMRVILISSDADAGRGGAAERAGAIAFVAKERLTGTAFRELIEPR